jgi:hypothetical protein
MSDIFEQPGRGTQPGPAGAQWTPPGPSPLTSAPTQPLPRPLSHNQFRGERVRSAIGAALDAQDRARYFRTAGFSAALRYGLGLPQMSASTASMYRAQALRRINGAGGVAPSSVNPGSWEAVDEPSQVSGAPHMASPRQRGSRSRAEALGGQVYGTQDDDQ